MPGQIGGPLARLSYLATSVPGKDDPISEESLLQNGLVVPGGNGL